MISWIKRWGRTFQSAAPSRKAAGLSSSTLAAFQMLKANE